MTVHDLKDIAMIYDDCDKYEVKVWEPMTQRRMNLCFTGSSKPSDTCPNGEINFNVHYLDEVGDNGVLAAFEEFARKYNVVKTDDEMKGLKAEFVKCILERRNE